MNYFYRIPYYLPNLSELLSFYISQNVGLGLGTDNVRLGYVRFDNFRIPIR